MKSGHRKNGLGNVGGAVGLENSSHVGHMITVIKHRIGHHIEKKIDFHYVTLEAELGPVGGIYKKPAFGSI